MCCLHVLCPPEVESRVNQGWGVGDLRTHSRTHTHFLSHTHLCTQTHFSFLSFSFIFLFYLSSQSHYSVSLSHCFALSSFSLSPRSFFYYFSSQALSLWISFDLCSPFLSSSFLPLSSLSPPDIPSPFKDASLYSLLPVPRCTFYLFYHIFTVLYIFLPYFCVF